MAPQRVADAANISPYPFVVRQERQANPPPENTNRPPKGKKAKPKPRTERNPRQEEEMRFNTGPRNLRNGAQNGRRGFRFPGRVYGDERNGMATGSLFRLPSPDLLGDLQEFRTTRLRPSRKQSTPPRFLYAPAPLRWWLDRVYLLSSLKAFQSVFRSAHP